MRDSKDMRIKDWPAAERPREKLLERGAGSLSDAELLSILIRTGSPGQTAVDLARRLLTAFGGLRPLLEASRPRLCQLPGVGDATYVTFRASVEMGHRYLLSTLKRGASLCTPQDTRRYVSARLRGFPYEVFACLFLDNRHRIIAFEEMFRGTIDGTSVHPREVVRRSLEHNAAALIVAHNHPSGVAEPSHADRLLTRRLMDAGALVDLRLLDHIVVGDGETVSFAERGWL